MKLPEVPGGKNRGKKENRQYIQRECPTIFKYWKKA